MTGTGILSAILAACVLFATTADAAPKKKKTQRKVTSAQTTATEKPAWIPTAANNPSAPQHHQVKYQEFVAKLKEIAKNGSFDLSPALYIVLKTTNDEFATELWMQQAASEGIAPAQLFVAQQSLLFLPEDQYKSADTKTAVALLKKASDSKYAPAMQEYSNCMRLGIGTFKNENGADRLLMEACRGGSFETRFEWLKQTKRMEKYEDLQRPEVQAEIKRGNHYILHHMSLMAPDDTGITQMLIQAAGKGNSTALYELSELHRNINIAKSYQLLTMAVRYRNPDALYRMATYMINPPTTLEINVGPVKNTEAGITMLKMASMLGQADAHAELARMYFEGSGNVKKDLSRAYSHVAIGAASGNRTDLAAAQGFMMLTGQGTKQDAQQGIQLIKIAAHKKDTYAMSLLGYAYYHGLGVTKNKSTAMLHFEDAVAHKDHRALIYLALMFDAEKEASKSRYYADHAERALPGKAGALLKFYKASPQGWIMSPFAP